MLRISVLAIVSLLAAAGGLYLSSEQTDAAGARLSFPSSDCSGTSAELTFKWTPVVGATEQSLDVSLQDNRFLEGTYTPIPLVAGVSSYTTQALDANRPHYWRINTKTAVGWEESLVGQFVPCGGPQLLWGPIICQSSTLSAVDFNWAPRADVLGYQYLELSSTVNFGANVTRVGPLAAFADGFRRGGFPIGERTFFRVVSEGFDGSVIATPIASFVPE
ncbi:MAG: hypothetical protein R3282_09530, partial [Rhodothermales bacterium]|nr:hypothetical protein [Rhodothermales bacterium]